jgi:hypothetical protein
MAKFNLKEHIAKNKATFFGSLTEGQFSWMTQDTGQQIGSQDENKIPVYMFDDKGKYYYENDYDGYGEFGGKDYYDLVAEMNGYTADDAEKFGGTFGELRGVGIKLAFGELEPKNGGPVLFPALVTKPDKFNYKSHNFAVEAETDPNQSWYEPEEDEEDNSFDLDDDEDYGYNDDEEELDENKENLKESVKILDRQADLDQAYFNLDVDGTKMSFIYWDYDEEFDKATYEEVMYMIEKQLINKDKYGFPVDPQLTPEQKEEIAQVVLKDLQTNPGWKSNLKENNKTKPTTKMKKSDLKAKIKEMIVAEYERDVDYTDETAGYDFLAELEGMLDDEEEFSVKLLVPKIYFNVETGELAPSRHAFGAKSEWGNMDITSYEDGDELKEFVFDNDIEKAKYFEKMFHGLFKVEGAMNEAEDDETEKDTAEAEDVTVDDTETIDTETEVEVDPNVKAVQDALTQAQVAAQKLGDPKLTDQIGNTITFFTREHVVEKPKSAVAEGDEMEEGKKEDLNESMFPMLKKILK